jgi:hypothetical protein
LYSVARYQFVTVAAVDFTNSGACMAQFFSVYPAKDDL